MDGSALPAWCLGTGWRWKPELVESLSGPDYLVSGCPAWLDLRDDGSFVCYDAVNTSSGSWRHEGGELVIITEAGTGVGPGAGDEVRIPLAEALGEITSGRNRFAVTSSPRELVLESRAWRIAFRPESAPSGRGEDEVGYDLVLSSALIAFAGRPGRLDGQSPEARVAARLGADVAIEVMPRVRAVLDAMNSADPPLYDVPTVADLARRAGAWLRVNHPEVSAEAIRVTANRFAYDWR